MHPVQAAKKLNERLEAIEQKQDEILQLLQNMVIPVEMVELAAIEIPEELAKKPKRTKAKVS